MIALPFFNRITDDEVTRCVRDSSVRHFSELRTTGKDLECAAME